MKQDCDQSGKEMAFDVLSPVLNLELDVVKKQRRLGSILQG